VASSLVALAVHGPLQEEASRLPKSDPLPAAALLPSFGRVRAGLLAACCSQRGAYALLTPFGFRLRAVGLAPIAALRRYLPRAHGGDDLALSRALAGLAGAFEGRPGDRTALRGLSAGTATAIAVALAPDRSG
jgi:ABC-type uncharacterized transport system permease subunit